MPVKHPSSVARPCLIVANGDRPEPGTAHRLAAQADLFIAADGGARHALALGLTPHAVIGDMDSLDPDQQAQLRAAGTAFIVHPPAKDETDLELALHYAVAQDADPIIVLGALGGRLDQTLANILLLTLPDLAGRDVRLVEGSQTAFLVRDAATIHGQPGDTVSLIPLGGPAHGVTTEGLLYALHEDTLPFGPALGVSNVLTASRAHVQLDDGLLLCVHLAHPDTQ